jgi:tetratricopeptide (TPR) repeat protein
MSLLVAAAILVTAPAAPVAQVDAAYDDLVANRDREAIARIEASAEHPAALINLGIAYARQGDRERAREAFERASRFDQRAHLETAEGEWVDSRKLALRALAGLDRGDLAPQIRTASR